MYLLRPEAQPGLPRPVPTAIGRCSIVLAADKCALCVFVFLEDFSWSAGSSLVSPEASSSPSKQLWLYIFLYLQANFSLSHLWAILLALSPCWNNCSPGQLLNWSQLRCLSLQEVFPDFLAWWRFHAMGTHPTCAHHNPQATRLYLLLSLCFWKIHEAGMYVSFLLCAPVNARSPQKKWKKGRARAHSRLCPLE